MEVIKQYDVIILRDDRKGCVVEILGEQDVFIIDIGSSPEDWETIEVRRDEIEKVIPQ
ncbi:hypothetical protein ACFSTH_08290 [Paenibacillus yanchengensis]|uniref:DUF3006 family protein n=1 Tax=Paenibacillus yanchengensis TaxID=2035833 RepID=A0ABW4YLJ2_9BACL